jgi:hypothetical protein
MVCDIADRRLRKPGRKITERFDNGLEHILAPNVVLERRAKVAQGADVASPPPSACYVAFVSILSV